MSAYRLTYSESLVLAVLLQFPVQPRSVLGDWFRIQKFPELTDDLLANSLAYLKDKEYYLPNGKSQPIVPALIRSLMLLSLNPAEITVLLRRHGRSALTRFAQMKRSVAQYSIDGEHLYIYPIMRQTALAGNYLLKALFGRADRPRIFHECTNSASIRLFVVNSWTLFSANYRHDL
mgnify:CR=1 FL=1